MLPFPKLFITAVNPVNELELLKEEVLLGNYFEIKYRSQGYLYQPQTISNLYTFMYGLGAPAGLFGTMWGTSFLDHFTQDSSYHRAYQHAFPSEAVYQFYILNPDTPCIMRRTAIAPWSGFIGITRNGYTSNSYGAVNYPSVTADLFVFWDESLQKVMKYNPFLNDTPTPYY